MSTEPNTGLTYQEPGSLTTDALHNEVVGLLGVWLNCVVQSVGVAAATVYYDADEPSGADDWTVTV